MASNNGFGAGIKYKGKLCGTVALHYINWTNRSTSIGYWLGKDYCGKGIMTKACMHVCKHLFETLDLNRVEISCAEGNTKSRAIPERLGFTKEGMIRDAQLLHGEYVNLVVYSLLKTEWETQSFASRVRE